jgi:hypothetical protein
VRFSPGTRRRIDDRDRRSVLGAGFGGLELCTLLSESLGESIEVTLIDKNDHFVFGFSKLDIMFGHSKAQTVHVMAVNATHRIASPDDHSEMAFDLLLGVPKHRVPTVVVWRDGT